MTFIGKEYFYIEKKLCNRNVTENMNEKPSKNHEIFIPDLIDLQCLISLLCLISW